MEVATQEFSAVCDKLQETFFFSQSFTIFIDGEWSALYHLSFAISLRKTFFWAGFPPPDLPLRPFVNADLSVGADDSLSRCSSHSLIYPFERTVEASSATRNAAYLSQAKSLKAAKAVGMQLEDVPASHEELAQLYRKLQAEFHRRTVGIAQRRMS